MPLIFDLDEMKFASDKLYEALSNNGGNGHTLDAGLGKIFNEENDVINSIFTIDREKKTVAIKNIKNLIKLADYWGPQTVELPSAWNNSKYLNKRNKPIKSAILLALAFRDLKNKEDLSQEDLNTIKSVLEKLLVIIKHLHLGNNPEDKNNLNQLIVKIEAEKKRWEEKTISALSAKSEEKSSPPLPRVQDEKATPAPSVQSGLPTSVSSTILDFMVANNRQADEKVLHAAACRTKIR